jgi:hypothetical protein
VVHKEGFHSQVNQLRGSHENTGKGLKWDRAVDMQGPEIRTPGNKPFKSSWVDCTFEAFEIEAFKIGKGFREAFQPVVPVVFYLASL